jgi:hypothetical protein
MSSPDYFKFLGKVWDNLPGADKERFGELWRGYEQIIASVYQKYIELSLNVAVRDLQPFSTERWLPYTFTDENFVDQPASLIATQDISRGINLSSKYLLKISIDGGDPIEINIKGAIPARTRLDEIITKINLTVGFTFAYSAYNDAVLMFISRTSGISSSIRILETSIPSANACEFVLGIQTINLPVLVPEYPWIYSLPYSGVASVPELRDAVRDESLTTTLVEGSDYILDSNKNLAFKTEPLPKMWAKKTLIDLETPWNNFGFLMNIYQKNSARYVDVLKGLWFAFWTGPKPINVKRSLYLLFGLPTALEDGVVTAVTSTEIQTTGTNGAVRTFSIPSGLTSIVSVGDVVEHFDPLVSGIDVFDKINYPGFIEAEIGRAGIQSFLTEDATRGEGDTDETKALTLLEEYTFLPQILVESFIYPDINMGNVKIFLDAIKPKNKTYLFQILVGAFRDPIEISDWVGDRVRIDVTPNVDSNQTTFISSADLDSYEEDDIPELNLDSDGILVQESVDIEVYSFGTLIDNFTA